MLTSIIERYTEDIVDAALYFIPKDRQKEFIYNLIQITAIHKREVEIYLKEKNNLKVGAKND